MRFKIDRHDVAGVVYGSVPALQDIVEGLERRIADLEARLTDAEARANCHVCRQNPILCSAHRARPVAAAVSVMTGLSPERLSELGGVPDDE